MLKVSDINTAIGMILYGYFSRKCEDYVNGKWEYMSKSKK